jgi:hypothetical protein
MATWPASLPEKPLNASLKITSESNVEQFETDYGKPARRKVFTAARKNYEAQMIMTDDQVALLDSFFHDDCDDGATSFMMSDWVTGTTRRFTWKSPPEVTHISGDLFGVALALETLV